MNLIEKTRKSEQSIVIVGNHPFIIQSILDFDYLSGKSKPTIQAIIGNSNGFTKYFWGGGEVLLPIYATLDEVPYLENFTWFLNLMSGRRVLSSSKEVFEKANNIEGGAVFAENVPEKSAIELSKLAKELGKVILGPASIGLLVPGHLKVGPIGGVTPEQVDSSGITKGGEVAVMAASGGMTNELINLVHSEGLGISFALSFGGDRFPVLDAKSAALLAQQDDETKTILYYGELGGYDEYELIKLKEQGKITKPMIIHIGGTVADLFPESPQFGHAKAKANRQDERARVKRDKLKHAGFLVSERFSQIPQLLQKSK